MLFVLNNSSTHERTRREMFLTICDPDPRRMHGSAYKSSDFESIHNLLKALVSLVRRGNGVTGGYECFDGDEVQCRTHLAFAV